MPVTKSADADFRLRPPAPPPRPPPMVPGHDRWGAGRWGRGAERPKDAKRILEQAQKTPGGGRQGKDSAVPPASDRISGWSISRNSLRRMARALVGREGDVLRGPVGVLHAPRCVGVDSGRVVGGGCQGHRRYHGERSRGNEMSVHCEVPLSFPSASWIPVSVASEVASAQLRCARAVVLRAAGGHA